MRPRLTIMAIVLAAATAAIGVIVLLVIALGWLGLAIGALGTLTVLTGYRRRIQPWQHRWGATDAQVRRPMPGDDLIPDAAASPRGRAQPLLRRRRPGSRRLAPGPVSSTPWLAAGQPVAGELAADPATAFWTLLSDPGAFIMERMMLKGIRFRAETTVRAGERRLCRAATPSLTFTVRR